MFSNLIVGCTPLPSLGLETISVGVSFFSCTLPLTGATAATATATTVVVTAACIPLHRVHIYLACF